MAKTFITAKITYTDYPSIEEVNAFIIFGLVTSVVKPIERMFSYWDMDDKTIKIEPITKEELINRLKELDFEEGESGVVQIEFDDETILSLSVCNDAFEFQWK